MLNRRDFMKVSCSGVAGLMVSQERASAAKPAAANQGYPVIDVAALSSIKRGAVIGFNYPDKNSPAVLLRLSEPAIEGIGPNNEIVAYSTLCTHKGCPINYRPERKLLICPCHWSSFDPAKAGTLVIGQASESLPQVKLRINDGMVQAFGMNGLIYGRYTNIL
ncbi:MAG: arsenate reductase (azurin) small subunit [Acidiferrobacterales bacterium]